MNIEEKAKAYDEALEKAKDFYKGYKQRDNQLYADDSETIFPELCESEDERVRKEIISFIQDHIDEINLQVSGDYDTRDKEDIALQEWCKKALAWLEKQGEQDNNEDSDILHRFSFYSYKDEPNILYLAGLYVNDKYRNKGIGTKILEIADEVAKSLNCHTIRLKTKKDSDAERLYQTNGYNILATEGKDENWFEKQGEQKTADKMQVSEKLYEYIRNTCACIDDALSSETLADIKDYLEMANKDAQSAFDMIEKQGEYKPVDKVKPKFKVGDFIVNDYCAGKVIALTDDAYLLDTGQGIPFSYEYNARLWTIKDAKDGDVLATDKSVFIYAKTLYNKPYAYCGVDKYGVFKDNCLKNNWANSVNNILPATKEQRDTLMKAMADAGYTFDFGKKELKKIEKKSQRMVSAEAKEALYDKPAWSEEDDNCLSTIIAEFSKCSGKSVSKDEWMRCNDFLNSLKGRVQPQKQWKPSAGQMKALHDLNLAGNISYAGQGQTLIELYNDLKKLKGE